MALRVAAYTNPTESGKSKRMVQGICPHCLNTAAKYCTPGAIRLCNLSLCRTLKIGPQGPRFQFLAERVGWALRARACGFAAAPVEQGSKAHTSLGEKTKRPHKGAFLFSGGEGGIRTHGTEDRILDFESSPFDHSGTSPACRGRKNRPQGGRFYTLSGSIAKSAMAGRGFLAVVVTAVPTAVGTYHQPDSFSPVTR